MERFDFAYQKNVKTNSLYWYFRDMKNQTQGTEPYNFQSRNPLKNKLVD